jgi:hypothetical protein
MLTCSAKTVARIGNPCRRTDDFSNKVTPRFLFGNFDPGIAWGRCCRKTDGDDMPSVAAGKLWYQSEIEVFITGLEQIIQLDGH